MYAALVPSYGGTVCRKLRELLPFAVFNILLNHRIPFLNWLSLSIFGVYYQKPRRFPILKLPKIAQELVVREMDLRDIFFFSLGTNVPQDLIKDALPSVHFTSVTWTVLFNKISISFDTATNGKLLLSFKSLSKDQWNWNAPMKCYKQVQFQNVEFLINLLQETSEISIYDCQPDTSIRNLAIGAFSIHIFNLFRVQNVEKFTSSEIPRDWVLPIVLESYRQIKTLKLFQSGQSPDILYSYQLVKILEDLRLETLHIDWKVDSDFKYRKRLKYENITVLQGSWVTIDCLLNMECATLTVKNLKTNFSPEQLNMFLRQWMGGEMDQLEFVNVPANVLGHTSKNIVFSGLNAVDWDTDTQRRCEEMIEKGYRNGRVIQGREGRIAVVAFSRASCVVEVL